jgi:hypothetical protein
LHGRGLQEGVVDQAGDLFLLGEVVVHRGLGLGRLRGPACV